ncbi:hypothetical protein KY284_008538 [Solanum tuberosum]|nr:hypothetical protein KY284_008538 [Solanum tuberosum]
MTNDGRSITVSALEWHSSSDENWETKFMYTLDDVFDHPRIMITVNSVNGTKPLVFTVGTDHSWRSLKAIRDRKFHSRHEKGANVKGKKFLRLWFQLNSIA